MYDQILQPCDIFFTHGEKVLSKLIRLGETLPGEEEAVVNHVGIVTGYGPIDFADVVEALSRVVKHTIYSQYHNQKDKVAIYRPINLNSEQKYIITNKANSYVGDKYGYFKIVTHLLDYFTGKHYFFRRLANDDNYPICSWVVAHAYKAAGLNFGCEAGMADPDDIWDFCLKNPDKYKCVFELSNI